MTFTIENGTDLIIAHITVEDAAAVTGAETFTSEAELSKLAASWPGARLIEVWNHIPGATPVKKFKDRATAVARIWKAIQKIQEAATAATPKEPAVEATEVPQPAAIKESVQIPEPAAEPTPTATPEGALTPDVAPEEVPASVKTTRAKKAPKAANEAKGPHKGSKTRPSTA